MNGFTEIDEDTDEVNKMNEDDRDGQRNEWLTEREK